MRKDATMRRATATIASATVLVFVPAIASGC
jgi:hypothetical protein